MSDIIENDCSGVSKQTIAKFEATFSVHKLIKKSSNDYLIY